MKPSERSAAAAVRRFVRDTRGQAVTEYILVLGLIVLPVALAFNRLQNTLKKLVEGIGKLLYGPGI